MTAKTQTMNALVVCCIVAYSFAFLVFGLQVNLLGPTVSTLSRRVGVIEADLGVIYTINGFLSIIGAVPSGWLVDKLPGHSVLAAALAFEALGFALIPYATSFAALATAFGTVALSWNIVNTAGNTFVLWIGNASENPRLQAFLINIVNALFGLGSLAAPLFAEACATWLANPLSVYWISAGLTAVSAAVVVVLPSPKPPNSASATPQAAGAAAAASDAGADALQIPLANGETNNAAAAAAATAADSDDGSSADSQCAAEAAPAAWWSGSGVLLTVIALFIFLSVGTEVAAGAWLYVYSCKQAGLSSHEGHFINASYWGAFTIGRVVGSFAAVLLSPATLLYGSLPLALLGSAAGLLAPASWMGGWLLLAVSILIGLGVSTGFANALAILDRFEPCTGSINGLLGGVAGAGCMTMPLVIALLAKHTALGYQSLMLCSLASFGVQLGLVPVALMVGRWLEQSREREDIQSVTKDVLPDEQQPLLFESEC